MVVWVQAGQVLVLEFPDLVSAQISTEYNRPGMLTVRRLILILRGTWAGTG